MTTDPAVLKLRALFQEAKTRHDLAAQRAEATRRDLERCEAERFQARDEAHAFWRTLRLMGDEMAPEKLELWDPDRPEAHTEHAR